MNLSILPYLMIRVLPTGRRLFAFMSVRKVAEELGLTNLVAFIDLAIAHDRGTLRLEREWEITKKNRSSRRGDAVAVDNAIDAVIVAIETVTRGHLVGEPNDPVVQTATKFLEQVFPGGVQAFTRQVFEQQLADLDDLLERFAGPLKPAVETLGLQRHAARLATLTEQFRVELNKTQASLTWDVVSAAQSKGMENLGAVVAQVIGTYFASDAPTTAKRESLLAEVNRQSALVSERLRRQRRVLDVNPDTGVEIDPSEETSLVDAA